VAQFDANIYLNTIVNQASLNKAAASIQKVTQAAKQIKPINLLAPGSGAGADKIRTSLAEIDKVVKNINAGSKGPGKLSTTFAGASQQASVLLDVLSNVNLKTKQAQAQIKNYADGYAAANKQAREQQRILNDVIRKAEGLQPQKQRDFEVARRKRLLQDRELERKAQAKLLAIEKQRVREQEKLAQAAARARRAEQQAAQEKKKARIKRLENVALGAGFPLLFGGGVGSIAGGIAGSFLGDGFGGQVLLSAFGQILDDAAKAAGEFAKQATKASTSIDQLITAFGIAGTSTASRSRFAETLGIGGAARAAQAGTLETIVGKEGIKSLEELGRSAEDAGNALNRFGAATSNFFAPLLTSLNDAIAGIFGGISKAEQARRLQDRGPRPSVAAGPGSAARAEFNRAAAAREASLQNDPEVKAQLELEEQINKVVEERINLARAAADFEARRLTSRRDVAAAERGSLEVQAQQNKLAVLEIQLQGQLEDSKRRELELERDLTKEAKRQAEEARANAIIEAERQITRDVSSQNQSAAQAYSESLSITQQLKDLSQSQVASYQEQQDLLKNQSTIQMALLAERREMELLGVTELELVDAINKKYYQLEEQEKRRLALQQERLRQDLIMFRYREQELIDNRELAKLEAARNAATEIRSMDFGRKFELSAAGFGFFGDSENFQEERLAQSAAQLESYNEQIGKLQARIGKLNEEGVDPDKIFPLQNKLDDLVSLRDTYETLQPAIDKAAIAQARFNDAFALVNPVMQNLVNNLAEVAKGTISVKEAFANMLDSVGKMLAQKGAEMIAQYIAIGIARAFAGMGGGGGAFGSGASAPLTSGLDFSSAFAGGFSTGGFVGANRVALVGENGPELIRSGPTGTTVTGNEDTKSAMERFSPSNQEMAAAGPMTSTINYNGPTLNFNGDDYIPRSEAGSLVSAGAKQGEMRAMNRLRQSRSTRSKVGI